MVLFQCLLQVPAGASALAYIDDGLRSATWIWQSNKTFRFSGCFRSWWFSQQWGTLQGSEKGTSPLILFLFTNTLFYLNEMLPDTFKLKVTQFIWLEFFKVVKLIKSEKTENLTVCRSLRPCNKTVWFLRFDLRRGRG